MTISQPIKSTFYCHTGSVSMNAITIQDCIHNPTFQQELVLMCPHALNSDDSNYLPQEYLHLVAK